MASRPQKEGMGVKQGQRWAKGLAVGQSWVSQPPGPFPTGPACLMELALRKAGPHRGLTWGGSAVPPGPPCPPPILTQVPRVPSPHEKRKAMHFLYFSRKYEKLAPGWGILVVMARL